MNDDNKNYGYGRCSTNESKQDVEYQIKELVEKGVKKENIFFEYESGAKEDRPDLFYRYYPMYKNNQINKKELSRLSKLSYPSIYKYIDLVETKEK